MRGSVSGSGSAAFSPSTATVASRGAEFGVFEWSSRSLRRGAGLAGMDAARSKVKVLAVCFLFYTFFSHNVQYNIESTVLSYKYEVLVLYLSILYYSILCFYSQQSDLLLEYCSFKIIYSKSYSRLPDTLHLHSTTSSRQISYFLFNYMYFISLSYFADYN